MYRGHRLDQIGIEERPIVDWPDWYLKSLENLKGRCLYCGKELFDKRRVYCKPKNEIEYSCKDKCQCAPHNLRVSPIRRLIHQIYKFECQECGEHFSYFTPAGAELPIFVGEVHHVIPLKDGGEDSIENVTLLCKKHHKEKTFPKKEEKNES